MTGLATALLGVFILPNFGALAAPILGNPPAYTVSMTGYNAVPEQTDEDPFTTASGAYSDPDVVAARSVDLAGDLPFGTVIAIDPSSATSSPSCGLGVVKDKVGLRVIADSMHPRKRGQIDILFDGGSGRNPADTLGLCKNVKIRVLGRIDIARMPRSQAELKRAVAQQLALKQW